MKASKTMRPLALRNPVYIDDGGVGAAGKASPFSGDGASDPSREATSLVTRPWRYVEASAPLTRTTDRDAASEQTLAVLVAAERIRRRMARGGCVVSTVVVRGRRRTQQSTERDSVILIELMEKSLDMDSDII